MKKLKNYWYHLSIKRKLLTFFIIISFFGAIINIYLHNNNYKVMDQFHYNLNNYYEINELLVAARNSQSSIQDYLRNHNDTSLDKYNETKEFIVERVMVLQERYNKVTTNFTVQAIKYSVEAYQEKWDKAILLKEADDDKYYVDYYDGLKIYYYTEQYLQELLYDSLNEGAIFYNGLVEKSKYIRTISFAIILVTFFLSLFFGGLFSNYIVAPIKKLVSASIQISKGDLDIEVVEVDSKDEVGILADSFNVMSKSIRRLVNDLKKKALLEKKLHEETIELMKMQQLLQEAEFLALQSQINPHFLFNTLNTISRTAMFEDAPDTTKLIEALSNIFRFSLRNTGKRISLQEELDMVKEYIYLQKFRFKDRLNFQVKCQIPLDDIEVPVFLIQPLIENAIIHGIEPKIKGGTVRLKIYQRGDKLFINILDTGVGISQEKLKSILTSSEDKKKSKSIGLRNVYDRFQMFFNNESKFTIQSKEGCGTVITLVIPLMRGEQHV